MSVAPPAAHPAHRRTLLTTIRFGVAAALALTFTLGACGGGSDGTGSGGTALDGTGSGATGASTGSAATTPGPSGSVADSVDPDLESDVEPGVLPEGFTTATVRIAEPDGEVCEVCVWLADNGDERSRGLMGVTDLGDAAGMLFVFDQATSGSFYMFETPRPLSIAWFAADGTHLTETDMEPCLGVPSDECALYAPDADYLTALEVWSGGLSALGIGPGSRLELVAGSEAASCASL
jgi:uncharacterized protein